MENLRAQELRIGNYIYRPDFISEELRIETVLGFCQNIVTCSGPIKVIIRIEDVKPIPLTEEWFIKLGFTIRYFNDDINKPIWWKLEGNRHIDIYFEKQVNSFVCMINSMQYSIEIKYVHQLQNLYFALTGEELIIK